jgi:hypothetical protein
MFKNFPSYFYSQIWLNQLIENHHLGYIRKLNKNLPWFKVESGDFWCPRLQRQLASFCIVTKLRIKDKKYKIVGEVVLARDDGMYY